MPVKLNDKEFHLFNKTATYYLKKTIAEMPVHK